MRSFRALVNASALQKGSVSHADLFLPVNDAAFELLLNRDVRDGRDPFFWPNSTALGSARPLTKVHLIYLQMFSFGVPSAATGW